MEENIVIPLFLISFALLVSSVPTPTSQKMYRGIPDEDGKVDPALLEKWEEFRLNITSERERSSLLSCLEDQTYSAINDFANCHLFCPMCNQGYGRCESTKLMRICICDCEFLPLILLPEGECKWISNLCTRVAESTKQALHLTACQSECQERGFSDAALCGADMEDPPLLRSTCTCLC